MTMPPTTASNKSRTLFAAAVAGIGSAVAAAAASSPADHQRAAHETLWGSPEVWLEPTTTTTTNQRWYCEGMKAIPRGGSKESSEEGHEETPSNKTSSSKRKGTKKNNKANNKERNQRSSKSKKTPKEETASKASSSRKGETSTSPKQQKQKPQQQPKTPQSTSNPMVEEILREEDLYAILGVSQGEGHASVLTKAYRRRAVQTHPDKTGGDRRAFDKVALAYEVLSDPEKSERYRRFGMAGLDPAQQQHGATSAEELFRSFFGGNHPAFFRQQQQQRTTTNRTLRYQIEVSLEDLYQGLTRTVTVEAPSSMRGFYGYYHQPEQDPTKTKQVELDIPRGSQPGQSIVLSGAMDFDSHDAPPGDLIFLLEQRPHPTFTRKNHDLAVTMTISLSEAIAGCTRTLTHLDGRKLVIHSAKQEHHPSVFGGTKSKSTKQPREHHHGTEEMAVGKEKKMHKQDADQPLGSVDSTDQDAEQTEIDELFSSMYIQTGDVQVLKGQGMPKDAHGSSYGDLYIQFKVSLPSSQHFQRLTPTERLELARLLDKLDGKTKHSNTISTSGWRKARQQQPENNIGEEEEEYTLEPTSLSDFGRASGTLPEPSPHEDEHHHDSSSSNFPFGGHRQFFFSSGGRSPFHGQETNFDDDESVQCRQM